MGGYIALRAVERNPERFSSLILCDTRPEADGNEAKLRRAAGIKAVRQDGIKAYAESFVKGALAPVTFEQKPVLVEQVKKMIRENSSAGICGALMAMSARTDTSQSLSNIQVH